MRNVFDRSCEHRLHVRWVICTLLLASPKPLLGEQSVDTTVTRCFAPTSAEWNDLRLTVTDPGSAATLTITGIPDGVIVHLDMDGEALAAPDPSSGSLTLGPVRSARRRLSKVRLFEEIPGVLPWIEERGCWMVERPSWRGIEEASVRVDASADLGWQWIDDEGGNFEGEGLIGGSLGARAQASGDGWHLRARIDQTHHDSPKSRRDEDPESEANVGTFLIEGSTPSVTLAIGDQDFGRTHWGFERSLIFGGFLRRGFSIQLGPADSGFRTGGFLAATRPTDSWASSAGADDPHRRILGAVATHSSTYPAGEFRIGAVYLDGETFDGSGASVAGDTAATANTLWGVAVDAAFFRHRVEVRGELAESRNDPDGGETDDAAARRDQAFALGVKLSDFQSSLLGRDLDWWFGLDHRRVGTFFRSLAHPAQANDLESEEASLGTTWRRFEGELRLGRHRDNVKDLDALPHSETTTASLSLAYRPLALRRFHLPTISLLLYQSDDETEAFPALGLGPSERSIRSLSLAAFGDSWDARYSRDEYRVFGSPGPGIVSEVAGVGLRVRVARWWLEPGLQASRLTGLGTTDTLLARLTARRSFHKVQSLLRADWLRRNESGQEPADHLVVAVDLNWRARQAVDRRPGVDLWLRGTYSEDEVDGTLSFETTQILLGARFTWSASW